MTSAALVTAETPTISPIVVVATARTGNGERDWSDELHFLWTEHGHQTFALLRDIAARGVKYPVQIAREPAGLRVVDGHHRVAACLALGIHVPVEWIEWANEPIEEL